MSYKSILVHVDDTARCAARVDIAFEIAARQKAHVTALALVQPAYFPAAARTVLGPDVERQHAQWARMRAEQALETFRQRASRAEVQGIETRSGTGDPATEIALHARYHDLAVVGQFNSDTEEDRTMGPRGFQDDLLLRLGRPVLMVPYAGEFRRIAENVVVAWDAGREAGRAVVDALPLLRQARRVTVLVINAEQSRRHGAEPGADIALFLARHGVQVSVNRENSATLEVGPFLLSRLADLDADLLVMGAYGHSRLREIALGGVTRTLLESMTLPVLMSH
jgi:nucleotide-binding universal stress UspA family protein